MDLETASDLTPDTAPEADPPMPDLDARPWRAEFLPDPDPRPLPIFGQGDGAPRRPAYLLLFVLWLAVVTAFVSARTAPLSLPSATSLAPAVTRVEPAVVDVLAENPTTGLGAAGSGLVVSADGLIVTNNHVIADANHLRVYVPSRHRSYRAVVVAYDRSADVAVLRVAARGLAHVTLIPASAALGQPVIALGNAGGRDTVVTASGTVTGTAQTVLAQDVATGAAESLNGLLRTDADIVPGDSGGPLVNTAGVVVALDVAAASANQTGSTHDVGFAIPIDRVRRVLAAARTGHAVPGVHVGPTAALGIVVYDPLSPAQPGATVRAVLPGGAAAAIGIVPGDRVLELGGHRVATALSLAALVAAHHPGDTVSVRWVTPTGRTHARRVALGRGPAQ